MTRSEPSRPVPLTILGPVTRGDIPPLLRELRCRVQEAGGGEVVCDVDGLGPPDAVALDALARLQMVAKRLGTSIQIENPCARLRDLLALTGLDAVLPVAPAGSGVERGREAEVGEQRPVEVDEVVDLGDPPA